MRRHLNTFLSVMVAVVVMATPAAGQKGFTPCDEASDTPQGRNHPLCKRKQTFNLFGLADNATAGLRTVSNVSFAVASSSIGDRTVMGNELPVYLKGTIFSPTVNRAAFFEYHIFQAAARGDFFRARDTVGIETLQNVRGGGYSFATNSSQYGGPDLFTGHDGSLGSLYEGANSATGSCRDMSFSFLRTGLKLLAISDCPETWPQDNGVPTWRGAPHLSEQSWLDYQNAVGKPNFNFDHWQVPALYNDPERQFIGTSAQTYATSSDHGRETRIAFGNVITPNAPDPRYEGYPLGLDWEWNAMTFNVSAVARMMVVEAKIINNSAEVYGKGIDYDSLYIGFQTRWLHAPPGNGRRGSPHAIPRLGAVVANELGRTANCDNARWPTGAFFTCAGVRGQTTSRGFTNGANGIMYLKSPIGDMRNKKFSDPASPFYNPSHPNVGDTITFNRFSMCGFECANIQFVDMNVGTGTAQRAFGTIAAREREALGTRAPTDMNDIDYFYLFKPKSGFETRVNLTNPRGGGGFNYCVPGNWRYTNRPKGSPATGPDTLFYDNCDPTTNTQTALWADTLPDRSMNMTYNNSWSGVGPFPLGAGDTTGFTFAIIDAPDSAQFMLLMQSAYDFYQDFYLGPGTPTPPRILYAAADSGIAGLAQNRVTLRLDYTEVNRADPSIPKTISKLAVAPVGTVEERLRRMNPWLLDSIRVKAPLLVDTVFIFKSCNRGRTFTATQTRGVCPTDRATNATGGVVGTGWRAYATLVRDPATGNFPATFTDAFVTGGQQYLYTIVAHRAPLQFTVLDSGVVGGTATVIQRTYTVLEATSSSLTTNPSAPNVSVIYVPVSAQLGAVGPVATRVIRGPTGDITIDTADVVAVAPLAGPLDYTTYFGDSASVITQDFSSRNIADTSTIYLYRNARRGLGLNGAPIKVFRDTLIFKVDHLLTVFGATPAADSTRTVVYSGADSVVTVRRNFRTLTAVVAETATKRPFFLSASLTSSTVPFQPPEALSLPGAPPLMFTIANRLTGSLITTFWREPGFTRVRAVGTPTINLDASTTRTLPTTAAFGEYAFEFRGSEFGPLAPFTVSLTNPTATADRYAASLAQRVRADTTKTDQATVDVINASLGTAYTTNDLAALYMPFITKNYGRSATGSRVTVAALKSTLPARAKLGSAGDTISFPVPSGEWIPGTPLIFIEYVPVAKVDGTGRPIVTGGQLEMDSVRYVTFSRANLDCQLPSDGPNLPRLTCNPVVGLGATGHVNVRPQQELHARYDAPFTSESEINFAIAPAKTGTVATRTSRGDLDRVLVVPNPYIFFTSYEQGLGVNSRRLLFTHVPPQGRIRIFTASGAFVQEFSWTPEMLGASGDIFWDMRTREGFEIGGGLYLFTVEATGPNQGAKRKRPGKFIIIK